MKRVDPEDLVADLAEKLSPILTEEVENFALRILADAADAADSPIEEFAVHIATSWVKDHGRVEAAILVNRFADGLRRGDIAAVSEDLDARELTELADTYQSAEAEQQAHAARRLAYLANILTQIGGYVARAALRAQIGAY